MARFQQERYHDRANVSQISGNQNLHKAPLLDVAIERDFRKVQYEFGLGATTAHHK